MKKLSIGMVAVALMIAMAMSLTPAFAAELKDVSALETGTYKVSIADTSVDNGMGFFLISDKNDELKDSVIIKDNSYGYIFFDGDFKGDSFTFRNVVLEKVSDSDLGVSGYHVYEIVDGQRDFDPVIDNDYSTIEISDFE